jgi:hypothetical protein
LLFLEWWYLVSSSNKWYHNHNKNINLKTLMTYYNKCQHFKFFSKLPIIFKLKNDSVPIKWGCITLPHILRTSVMTYRYRSFNTHLIVAKGLLYLLTWPTRVPELWWSTIVIVFV